MIHLGLIKHDCIIMLKTNKNTIVNKLVNNYIKKRKIFRDMQVAIFITFISWICLMLPRIWTYEIVGYTMITSPNLSSNVYVTSLGPFAINRLFRLAFTYLWVILGYFIPVVILVFCNVRLVQVCSLLFSWGRKEFISKLSRPLTRDPLGTIGKK